MGDLLPKFHNREELHGSRDVLYTSIGDNDSLEQGRKSEGETRRLRKRPARRLRNIRF